MERRKHFRGGARPGKRIELRYRAAGTPDEFRAAITRNIGVGGALIVSEERPATGTLLELLIALPQGAEELRIYAEVRWHAKGEDGTKGGIGVRFVDLPVDSLLALSDYFATLAAE